MGSCEISDVLQRELPDSFEMHCPYFDNGSLFLTLQNTIPLASAHAGHVQQFCAVDKVVVYESVDVSTRGDLKRN
jgi:hypothetical protein